MPVGAEEAGVIQNGALEGYRRGGAWSWFGGCKDSDSAFLAVARRSRMVRHGMFVVWWVHNRFFNCI